MRIAEIMHRSLVTVRPDTQIADARWIARKRGIRHLPVVDGSRLLGIMCLCDFEGSDERAPVASVMSAPVRTIGTRGSVDAAARLMREHRIGCVPVVAEENHLLGIVTRGDLLRLGIAPEQVAGDRRCASCGTLHDLASHPHTEEVQFCRECLECSGPNTAEEELGGGD